MVRILIVEDNAQLLETLADQLGLEPGFEVSGVANLADARKKFKSGTPDIVLVEDSLPDGNGHDMCRWIRGEGHELPILILTDRSGEMDSIDGLEAGANDYVPKPIRVRELVARMKAHLDRHRSRAGALVEIGPFRFNPGGKTLAHRESGETRTLTEKEGAIIDYLAGRKGGTVGKDELLKKVWGYDERITTHTLETHIYRLRRKMGGMDKARVLLTDKDGYRLDA